MAYQKRLLEDNTPRPGDAVILGAKWRWGLLDEGSVGILGGMIAATPGNWNLTFRYSAFNDGRKVSCSGGPATIFGPPVWSLVSTGQIKTVQFWKWNKYGAGAGNGETYIKDVPLWVWLPSPELDQPWTCPNCGHSNVHNYAETDSLVCGNFCRDDKIYTWQEVVSEDDITRMNETIDRLACESLEAN